MQSSLNRIRANKKLTSSAFTKDQEIEDTINTVKRRARLDLGEKLLEAAGDDDAGETIRRRALKVCTRVCFEWHEYLPIVTLACLQMVTRASDDFVDPKSLTKWTSLSASGEESNKSAASQRARATKARLAELESDMFDRSEKQAARENRSAQLKRFMVESNIESSSSSRTEKHVNF